MAHPVWMFVHDDAIGETVVRPVKRLPVVNLSGKLVGTKVRLANGSDVWALLGNIKPHNPRMTEHFLSISLERGGNWFHLARYFDADYASRSPDGLAKFLDLSVDEVFPISYDVRRYGRGDTSALAGTVTKEPTERLTIDQLIGLAVPKVVG